MSRIGPLAYPIAMAAALNYYTQSDPKRFTRSKQHQVAAALSGMAGFFTDQSYMGGVDRMISAARDPESYSIDYIFGLDRQFIPLVSLQGWVARIVDPIYRNPKEGGLVPGDIATKGVNTIISGIPFLSKTVPAYTDPAGQPSERKNLLFNALSPIQVSPAENAFFETLFQLKNQENAFANIKTKFKNGDITEDEAMAAIDKLIKEGFTPEESAPSAQPKAPQPAPKTTAPKEGGFWDKYYTQ
jgi:hypothetical protein